MRTRHSALRRLRILALSLLCLTAFGHVAAQEITYLALQRPGQGSLAIDRAKKTAYITDLGKNGDGDRVMIDGIPLLESLAQSGIRHLVFTCSHPHSDHMGGIRALFEKPQAFFKDQNMTTPRFESVTVIDDGAENSLFSMLKKSLNRNAALDLSHLSARGRNAFQEISGPQDDVYIQSIPYEATDKAGPHGRSVVTLVVLGQEYSNVDFDDASSDVIRKTVENLKSRGVESIDSFVVPHHGSAYHDIEPILTLKPKTAIIAVNSRNPYGHPAPGVLLGLIDELGAEHVLFTGSVDHVVFGPNGLKHAKYSANDPESYKLFVRPGYARAKNLNRASELALYRQLEARMLGSIDSSPEDGTIMFSPQASAAARDEFRAELDAAEQANDDLLLFADKLALGTRPMPDEESKLTAAVSQQGQRLERLVAHTQNFATNGDSELSEDRDRLDRIFSTIHSASA